MTYDLIRWAEKVIRGNARSTVILAQEEAVAMIDRIAALEAEVTRLREALATRPAPILTPDDDAELLALARALVRALVAYRDEVQK